MLGPIISDWNWGLEGGRTSPSHTAKWKSSRWAKLQNPRVRKLCPGPGPVPAPMAPAASSPSQLRSPSQQRRPPGCSGGSARSCRSSGRTWTRWGWWWACGRGPCKGKDALNHSETTKEGLSCVGSTVGQGQGLGGLWGGLPFHRWTNPGPTQRTFPGNTFLPLSLESCHTSSLGPAPPIPAACLSSDSVLDRSAEKSLPLGHDLGWNVATHPSVISVHPPGPRSQPG